MKYLAISLLIFLTSHMVHAQDAPLCFEFSGEAIQTSSGKAVHWLPSNFPIHLTFNPFMGEDEKEAIILSATLWNVALEAEVFKFGPNPSQPNVYIDYVPEGEANDILGATLMRYDEDGQMQQAKIVLRPITDKTMFFYTMVHELGHLLGLDHDWRDTGSIMYPSHSPKAVNKEIREEDLLYISSQIRGCRK